MNATQRLVVYSIIRLVMFFGITVVLWYLGFPLWAAGLFAAVISFALSFLFLRPQRDAIAGDLQRRREKPAPDEDGAAEDAAVDDSERDGVAEAEREDQ